MSEYQYYEFRAVDKPLSNEQKAAVSNLYNRAVVSPYWATFVYNGGEFAGDVEQLMADTFDMMLHVTNWGTRQVMIRLPIKLFDVNGLRNYFISEAVTYQQQGDFITLNWDFSEEGSFEWLEGDGLLDKMRPLREDLLQGDYRVLYLAWLRASYKALAYGDINHDTLEPPVPSGLAELSAAQQTFAEFIGLDAAWLQVAALNSPTLQHDDFDPEPWLAHLPVSEKEEFLLRLCRNEANLHSQLVRRLKALYHKEQKTQPFRASSTRRTVQALQVAYAKAREVADREAQEAAERQAEAERQKMERKRNAYLAILRGREQSAWKRVQDMVQSSNGKSYQDAVQLVLDLQEIAARDGTLRSAFKPRMQHLREYASQRPALLRRLQEKGLA